MPPLIVSTGVAIVLSGGVLIVDGAESVIIVEVLESVDFSGV
ncbi:MAG: hypothetical protein ABI415_03045 [Flavitalea sp.]